MPGWRRPARVARVQPTASGEAADSIDRALQAGLVEEVRDAVPDLVRRAVEVVGAGGGVQRIAHRDLVADDEDAWFPPCEEALERGRVAASGVVERLAAGERLVAAVRALPGTVVVDRPPLEVAERDVVEQRLLEERNATRIDGQLRRLE